MGKISDKFKRKSHLYKKGTQETPLFSTIDEALIEHLAKAKEFEVKYNKNFEDLFLDVEHSSSWTEDEKKIHVLYGRISMCKEIKDKTK